MESRIFFHVVTSSLWLYSYLVSKPNFSLWFAPTYKFTEVLIPFQSLSQFKHGQHKVSTVPMFKLCFSCQRITPLCPVIIEQSCQRPVIIKQPSFFRHVEAYVNFANACTFPPLTVHQERACVVVAMHCPNTHGPVFAYSQGGSPVFVLAAQGHVWSRMID